MLLNNKLVSVVVAAIAFIGFSSAADVQNDRQIIDNNVAVDDRAVQPAVAPSPVIPITAPLATATVVPTVKATASANSQLARPAASGSAVSAVAQPIVPGPTVARPAVPVAQLLPPHPVALHAAKPGVPPPPIVGQRSPFPAPVAHPPIPGHHGKYQIVAGRIVKSGICLPPGRPTLPEPGAHPALPCGHHHIGQCNKYCRHKHHGEHRRDYCKHTMPHGGHFTFGAGIGTAINLKSADSSIGFRTADKAVSTTFNGTVTVGYQHHIGHHYFLGIEAGIDFGTNGRTTKIENTRAKSSYQFQAGILRQMLTNIARSIDSIQDADLAEDGATGLIDADVWQSFVGTIRGNSTDTAFVDAPAGRGVYMYDNPDFTANPDAVFADFVSDRTIASLAKLGDGDALKGAEKLRNFVAGYYPNIGTAINNMATVDLDNTNDTAYGAGDPAPVSRDAAANIVRILTNRGDITDINDVLGTGGGVDATGFAEDMNNLNDLNYIDDEYAKEVQYSNIKPSFGICPHIAIKIGHYVPVIHSSLYGKVGFMQLNAKFVNSSDNKEIGKCRRITPFFAIGVDKGVCKNFGIALEFSHALKTRKAIFREKINSEDHVLNMDLSRSSLKLMGVVNFSLSDCFK